MMKLQKGDECQCPVTANVHVPNVPDQHQTAIARVGNLKSANNVSLDAVWSGMNVKKGGRGEVRRKYYCECGSSEFSLEDKPVYYGKERRLHAQLVCAKCKVGYDIQPCNTNGLMQTQEKGEIPKQ